jgi:MFS family permease
VFAGFALGLLNSTVSVSASAIVGKAADPERRPLVYGVMFSLRDLGVVSAAVGSALLGSAIPMALVFGLFAAVFAGCAGLSLLLGRYAGQRL